MWSICGGHAIAGQAGDDPGAERAAGRDADAGDDNAHQLDDETLDGQMRTGHRPRRSSGTPLDRRRGLEEFLAVPAGKAGRHSQAMSIALTAAAHPGMARRRSGGWRPNGAVLQRSRDRRGVERRQARDPPDDLAEAAAIAADLTGPVLLLAITAAVHLPPTVELDRILLKKILPRTGCSPSPQRSQIPSRQPRDHERRARALTHWLAPARDPGDC